MNMKITNMNIAAPVKVWKGGRSVSITPIIHSKSQLWEAFHNSPMLERKDPILKELDPSWARGNNPHEMIKTFLQLKGISGGSLVEAGVFRDCAIPNIEGSEVFIVSQDGRDIARTFVNYPYARPVTARLEDLPCEPLKKDSFDLAVWHGGFTVELKLCAFLASALPLEKAPGVLKAIKGLWSIIKPGGYFIEFYPFDDWKDLPKALHRMKLDVASIELIRRYPERIDPYEVRHAHLMYAEQFGLETGEEANDLLRDMVRDRENYLAPFLNPVPFSVMIIRK